MLADAFERVEVLIFLGFEIFGSSVACIICIVLGSCQLCCLGFGGLRFCSFVFSFEKEMYPLLLLSFSNIISLIKIYRFHFVNAIALINTSH